MAGQARRTKRGRRDDDLRGEFTVVAVPGTHRDRTRSRYGNDDRNQRIGKADKQKLLLDARREGRSWREAAKIAGYRSVGSAYVAAQEAIANIPREAADEARAIEMQRLDEVIRANWRGMQAGDTFASQVILKAIESRRRMLGLDLQEPEGVTLDVQLQATIIELLAMNPIELESELSQQLARIEQNRSDVERATDHGEAGSGSSRATSVR